MCVGNQFLVNGFRTGDGSKSSTILDEYNIICAHAFKLFILVFGSSGALNPGP